MGLKVLPTGLESKVGQNGPFYTTYKKNYAAKKLNNKTVCCEIIDCAAKKLINKTIDYEIIDDDSDDDEIIDYEIIDDHSDEDNGYDSDSENDSLYIILF